MTSHHDGIMREIEQRRFDRGRKLLKVYAYYRVLVGMALIAVFSQQLIGSRLGILDPSLFFWVIIGYSIINLGSALLVQVLPQHYFAGQKICCSLVAYDIFALTWMTYLSGGVGSGLGLLILASVATGAIIVTGRATTLLAALATIAVLYEEFYLSLSAPDLHDDYFQAGVLGIAFFAFTASLHNLSKRIRQSDVRALTQAVELTDLERINRQIVQRMRTGIILADRDNKVRMANQSARALVGQVGNEEFTLIPQRLLDRLNAWREDTDLRTQPFQVQSDTPVVRVNFSPVQTHSTHGDVTIFIEDTAELQQQAQQLKLAALGRLSANIAHEIRNPLGAISHAAQLLGESSNLDKGDTRLTHIIHNHCQRMNGVIENVLDMSRRSPPSPIRLSIKDYLNEFAEDFKQSVSAAIIDIEVAPSDTEIRVDKSQLGQVLTNLVGNGIRYSAEQSDEPFIRLEGGVDSRTDRPYLNVVDHGPGVADEQIANLFEPFFTTERAGTGLGLYISRELCEANQAQISYYRHDEGGSCFRITFAHPDRISA